MSYLQSMDHQLDKAFRPDGRRGWGRYDAAPAREVTARGNVAAKAETAPLHGFTRVMGLWLAGPALRVGR